MDEQKGLVDYGFSESENYSMQVSAFCTECDAELDMEELEHAASTGSSQCTLCFYETEDVMGRMDTPSKTVSFDGMGFDDLNLDRPGVRVLNLKGLKPRTLTEDESTLLRRKYRETLWKLRILSGAAQKMLIHADFKYPNETGGMCFGPLGRRLITHVTWLKNTASHPRGLYEPNGQEWFDQIKEMKERGLEWKAWWHSHPGFPPLPSGIDTGYHKHKVHMIICNAKSGDIRAYNWDKKNPKELLEVRMEVK